MKTIPFKIRLALVFVSLFFATTSVLMYLWPNQNSLLWALVDFLAETTKQIPTYTAAAATSVQYAGIELFAALPDWLVRPNQTNVIAAGGFTLAGVCFYRHFQSIKQQDSGEKKQPTQTQRGVEILPPRNGAVMPTDIEVCTSMLHSN